MPNAKVLSEKQAIVADLAEQMKKASAGVLVDYRGITVADDTALRRNMREANVEYAVVKNTLLRFAAKNVGLDELDSVLNGTTSLAISTDDVVAPCRVVNEYAEKLQNCFEIKGGFMDGKVISVDEIKALAKIPPLPQLRAQVLGTMLAPISSLACVLKAIAEKDGEPEAAPAE
jgi:large subunit ribosomal protein L10